MLPLPRPRPDPDVVRARLAALATGDWAGAYADDPRAAAQPAGEQVGHGDDAAGGASPDALEPGAVVVTRPSTRAVVLAVALTALVTWVVAHVTSGGSPQPIELAPGTPIASASGVLPVPSGAPPSGGQSGGASGGLSGAPAAGGATSAGIVVVQVIGEVRRPGLVRLPVGARVADAVARAGGVRPGGGTGGLNLARVVVDGEQIVVSAGVPVATSGSGSGPSGTSGGGASDVVDLNTATLAELDALPGVGPVMAGRILDWRTSHGRFASIDQLREISGIGAKTFDRLKPHVRA